jgi:hypothetical protein
MDQYKTNNSIVAYKTCEFCGFRLVRVEPASDDYHPVAIENCSICGMQRDEKGLRPGKKLSLAERLAAFEAWLSSHGLSRDLIENRYFLRTDSFFAN